MSQRPPAPPRELHTTAPMTLAEIPNLLNLFHKTMDIAGTGKRKVDGELAATRLGKPVTDRWTNERFRQVMLLIRQFKMEWPNNKSLLSADLVRTTRSSFDSFRDRRCPFDCCA